MKTDLLAIALSDFLLSSTALCSLAWRGFCKIRLCTALTYVECGATFGAILKRLVKMRLEYHRINTTTEARSEAFW